MATITEARSLPQYPGICTRAVAMADLAKTTGSGLSCPADGIAPRDDAIDQRGYGTVLLKLNGSADRIVMRGRRVPENTDDFTFGQHLGVVQRKQQGFANGQCRNS
jgi:hypothetical protein